MSALIAERNTPCRASVDHEFPVAANTKILAGAIVVLSGTAATKGATAANLRAVGVAQATADNSAGAAGAINVKTRRGTFKFVNYASDAITLAHVGTSAYIVDDQTVAATNGGSTRSVAGTIRDVDSDGVWVEF